MTMANDKKAIVKNFAMPSPILSGLINGIKGEEPGMIWEPGSLIIDMLIL